MWQPGDRPNTLQEIRLTSETVQSGVSVAEHPSKLGPVTVVCNLNSLALPGHSNVLMMVADYFPREFYLRHAPHFGTLNQQIEGPHTHTRVHQSVIVPSRVAHRNSPIMHIRRCRMLGMQSHHLGAPLLPHKSVPFRSPRVHFDKPILCWDAKLIPE